MTTKPIKMEMLGDCPELIPVIAQWYFDQWGEKEAHSSMEKITERLRGGLDPASVPVYFVAVENHRPVGSAALKIREMAIHQDKTYWLGDVYVRADRRGRGIASALVREGERLARHFAIRHLCLYTPDQEGLYNHLGWKTIDRVQYEGEAVVVMERRLDAEPSKDGR